MKKIILVCGLLTGLIYGQEFQISDHWYPDFTLDKYDQSVYWIGGGFKKTKIPELETEEVEFFPFLFFNKSHKCLYKTGSNIYLHDFETGADSFFAAEDTVGTWFMKFSPNDKYLLFGASHYKILDMQTHDIINVEPSSAENSRDTRWSSDTSLVIIENSLPGTLIECFPFSGRIDTIISSDEILYINSVAINYNTNKIAFSVDLNTPGTTEQVRQYDPKTGIFDTLVENSMLNYSCTDEPLIFNSLDWSPKNDLFFITYSLFISGSGVNVFFPNMDSLYIFEECDYLGVKVDGQWLNEDIAVYYDNTRKRVYGYDLRSPLAVKENKEIIPVKFDLTNYPNPFNPSTKIQYSIPNTVGDENFRPLQMITMKIYDILGHQVATLVNKKQTPGLYEVEFDGSDLPSGVYFAQFIYNTVRKETHSRTIKIVLIK